MVVLGVPEEEFGQRLVAYAVRADGSTVGKLAPRAGSRAETVGPRRDNVAHDGFVG